MNVEDFVINVVRVTSWHGQLAKIVRADCNFVKSYSTIRSEHLFLELSNRCTMLLVVFVYLVQVKIYGRFNYWTCIPWCTIHTYIAVKVKLHYTMYNVFTVGLAG